MTQDLTSLSDEELHDLSHEGMKLHLQAIREYKGTENIYLKVLLLNAICTFGSIACAHVATKEVEDELQLLHKELFPQVVSEMKQMLFKH